MPGSDCFSLHPLHLLICQDCFTVLTVSQSQCSDLCTRSNLTSKSEFTPFWACPDHYSPPILVKISKFGQQMHFSTVKIPVKSGLDWSWTSPSFLIPKLLFFSLWRCGLRPWSSPWFVSMLFRDCFTVSTPAHMGNAQPKWNGASSAVVLNLN